MTTSAQYREIRERRHSSKLLVEERLAQANGAAALGNYEEAEAQAATAMRDLTTYRRRLELEKEANRMLVRE